MTVPGAGSQTLMMNGATVIVVDSGYVRCALEAGIILIICDKTTEIIGTSKIINAHKTVGADRDIVTSLHIVAE